MQNYSLHCLQRSRPSAALKGWTQPARGPAPSLLRPPHFLWARRAELKPAPLEMAGTSTQPMGVSSWVMCPHRLSVRCSLGEPADTSLLNSAPQPSPCNYLSHINWSWRWYWHCVYSCSSITQHVKASMRLRRTSELDGELLACCGSLGPRKFTHPSPLHSRCNGKCSLEQEFGRAV